MSIDDTNTDVNNTNTEDWFQAPALGRGGAKSRAGRGARAVALERARCGHAQGGCRPARDDSLEPASSFRFGRGAAVRADGQDGARPEQGAAFRREPGC